MPFEEYTNYAYNEKIDLTRKSYWIYGVAETPPGSPRTPMFDYLFMQGGNWGAGHACSKLCMPSTSAIAFRSYCGYQLMSVVLPQSDQQTDRRSQRFKAAIQELIGNYDAQWETTKTEMVRLARSAVDFSFDDADGFALAQLLNQRIDAERRMYEAYFYFAEGLGAVYANFERVCREMLGLTEPDADFQTLLGGFDNRSYDVERGLYELASQARELGVGDILTDNRPDRVAAEMNATDSGRIWMAKLDGFLRVHGWRCSVEMEYIAPSWVEDPVPAIGHIQQYLRKGGPFTLDATLETQAGERRRVEREIAARISPGQRQWFEILLAMAQKYAVWKVEHPCFLQMYQYAVTRHALVGIGRRLCETGCINAAEDTLFLVPDEVLKALLTPEACLLASIVEARRKRWQECKDIVAPPLIAKVSPAEVGRMIVKSKDPLAARLMMESMSVSEARKADLTGLVAAPGVGEGPVRIVLQADQLRDVQPGDVLVAPAIRSSWSPVFSLVKGIVTDRGGTLSSCASVGREYGIPVVTNVIDGTSRLKTGQRVRVDGTNGVVYILDLLHGKKILVVDDEPDVLEVFEELVDMCDVVTAGTFDQARELLTSQRFDLAVLDIMGVDGYQLLEIARQHDVPAVMLTAHALSLEDTVRSYRQGAVSYVPKEELADIVTILNDVLEAKARGKQFWWRWFDRFGAFYEKRFGSGWQNKYPEFMDMFGHGK